MVQTCQLKESVKLDQKINQDSQQGINSARLGSSGHAGESCPDSQWLCRNFTQGTCHWGSKLPLYTYREVPQVCTYFQQGSASMKQDLQPLVAWSEAAAIQTHMSPSQGSGWSQPTEALGSPPCPLWQQELCPIQ